MNWVKQNSYITVLFLFSLFVISVVAITDEKIEQYEQVFVEHGDTLWSLANEYRGKMSMQDWIIFVKEENRLANETIIIGQQLKIPVEKSSNYIAKITTEESNSVKVASEN
ncbi:LysM peptidoglycan-binding domain-containing protein [Solibacillus sp. CAU 1738]|uniref:cell division suppressor protein YneA n=1 Tax=Solibacillus sp. CAU 1738 TaxID=3140363 RepID=UPI003261641E